MTNASLILQETNDEDAAQRLEDFARWISGHGLGAHLVWKGEIDKGVMLVSIGLSGWGLGDKLDKAAK